MTPNLLDELEERLGELKSTLAIMAKYAPAPGVLCAPTMEMGLGWKAKALLPKIEAAHTALSHMAKRMEAAKRDASGERAESWEVWQDDMCVAGSDSLADAQHYMMMYGQDGPVRMVHVVTFRSDVIETVPANQLAIDATQEGEG